MHPTTPTRMPLVRRALLATTVGLALTLLACSASENAPTTYSWTVSDPVSGDRATATGDARWGTYQSPYGEIPPRFFTSVDLRSSESHGSVYFDLPAVLITVSGHQANRFPTDITLHIGPNGIDTLGAVISAINITYVADCGTVRFSRVGAEGLAGHFNVWLSTTQHPPYVLRMIGDFNASEIK
jgi:hypothetical protein